MSDYSPPPRAGYTKTGKSIRAVKRYYAMKNKDAKKKKSPDDEKLSKRIAAELKVQQEANKKRNRQSGTIDNETTERSALPIIMQPREVGPTFVTSPKSVKSAKSAGTVAQIVENPTYFIHNFSSTSNGCVVSCFFFAIIYVATWIHYLVLSKKWESLGGKPMDTEHTSFNSIKWIAITSIGPILIVPIWLTLRDRFSYALLSLLSMIACAVSLLAHLVYYIITDKSVDTTNPKQPRYYLSPRNPLNFWLSISFLMMTMVAMSIMIKQLLSLISRQIDNKDNNIINNNSREAENGQGPALSQYMAPG